MKRYRVMPVNFDYRAKSLATTAAEHWTAEAKMAHERDQQNVRKGLIDEYGSIASDQKIQNFIDLGPSAWSVLAYHNKFFSQIRHAFVIGSYYPALTGACALGERILNHLLLALRDSFKGTPEYKKVYRKDSFDDWDLAIGTLDAWKVLLPEVVVKFRELKKLRNDAIHFRAATELEDRTHALEAIHTLRSIVDGQFGGFGAQPWFIKEALGYSFIRRSVESDPFIRAVYLPSCVHVGPYHTLEWQHNRWIVIDTFSYEDKEISDEEFMRLLNDRASHPASTKATPKMSVDLKPRLVNIIATIAGGLILAFIGFCSAFAIGLYAGVVPAAVGLLGLAWSAVGVLTAWRRNKFTITIGVTGISVPVGNLVHSNIQRAIILREQIAGVSKRASLKGRVIEITTTSGGKVSIPVRQYCELDKFLSICEAHGLPVA